MDKKYANEQRQEKKTRLFADRMKKKTIFEKNKY